MLPAMPMAKFLMRNREGLKMGAFERNASTQYRSWNTPPEDRSRAMRVLSAAPPAVERPMVTSTAEEEKRKKPAQSNFCSRTALRSGISFQVAHRPAMPTGMLIRKIQCQEAYWTMMPPSTGPRRGPSSAGIVTMFRTLTNMERG